MCENLKKRNGVTLISMVITIVILLIIAGITILFTLDSDFLNITSGTKEDLAVTNIKDYGSVVKSSISIDVNLTKNNLVDMFADEVVSDNIAKSEKDKFKVIDRDYDNLLVTLSRDGAVAVIDLSDLKFADTESNLLDTTAKHTVTFRYRELGEETEKKFIINTGVRLANFFVNEDDSFLEDKTWAPELDLNEPITKSITYTEHTYRLKTVIASFDLTGGVLNGNTTVEDVDYKEGDIVENIGTPTKEHYIFESWQPPLNEIIEEDTLFVAQWIPRVYTYTFKLNGGNISGSTNDVIISGAYGTKANKPANPTRADYDFVNWSPSLPENFEGNNTYTAQWVIKTYTFTFKMNGGTSGGTTADKIYSGPVGSTSQQPVPPTRQHYNFKDWGRTVPGTFTADITFTAQWTPVTYTFTFRLNGGNISGSTANRTTSGPYNTNSTRPANPVRNHYDFLSWSPSVPAKYDGNKTFEAQWKIKTYTHTFRMNGGTSGGSTSDRVFSGTAGSSTQQPAAPTYTHYTFTSWGRTVPPTYEADIIFTAQRTPKTYTYTFRLNGGTIGGSSANRTTSGAYGSSTTFPPTPVRDGYLFNNWGSVPTTYQGNQTFTAQWTVRTYTITFNLDGGRYNNSTSNVIRTVSHGSTPASFTPTKSDHDFLGWTPVLSPATSNRTYKAVWGIPMQYQIKRGSSSTILIPVVFSSSPDGFYAVSINGGSYVRYTTSNPRISSSVSASSAINVKVAGRLESFTYNGASQAHADQMYRLNDWGVLGVKTYSFDNRAGSEGSPAGCKNLGGTIPTPRGNSFANVTNLYRLFGYCSGLSTTIPSGLLSNAPKLTDVQFLFLYAVNLRGSIPASLFANATNITNFHGTFERCYSLTGSIPVNLFRYNTKATTFESTFYNAKSLTGSIPGDLFRYNTRNTKFWNTFRHASSLTGRIPEKLFYYCPNVTTFRNTFDQCTGLTGSIPADLFVKNTNVTIFDATFRGCSGLSGTIPAKLFDKCTKVTDFHKTFLNCGGFSGAAPELWKRTNVTRYTQCFYNNKSLSNWNSIPSGWK